MLGNSVSGCKSFELVVIIKLINFLVRPLVYAHNSDKSYESDYPSDSAGTSSNPCASACP